MHVTCLTVGYVRGRCEKMLRDERDWVLKGTRQVVECVTDGCHGIILQAKIFQVRRQRGCKGGCIPYTLAAAATSSADDDEAGGVQRD
jgi:hypothetical protein